MDNNRRESEEDSEDEWVDHSDIEEDNDWRSKKVSSMMGRYGIIWDIIMMNINQEFLVNK